MGNNFSEEEYKSTNEEKDSDGETNFKENIDNNNSTECFSCKFGTNNKIIKIPYYVEQVLILWSEKFIVASNSSVIFLIKIITLNLKRRNLQIKYKSS